MRHLEAKVVVLGAQGVGKTSIVVRYTRNCFNKTLSPTIGASFFTCSLHVGDRTIKLQVWDTAGQERFRAMAPMYYRKAHAALLIYDISSRESFQDICQWVKELQKNIEGRIVFCLVGNKCDLTGRRKVSNAEACAFADSIGAKNFEVSALSGAGIDAVFHDVAQSLVRFLTEEITEYSEDHFAAKVTRHQSIIVAGSTPNGSTTTVDPALSQRTFKNYCC